MSSVEGKPKGTKRARTREALLDAATALFRARGIAATSLDEIAAHAGVTKGAIYGSFASKDELVFAVANERIERGLVTFDGTTPVREQLARIVRQALGDAPVRRAQFAFLVEIDLYSQTREELAVQFMAAGRGRIEQSARALETLRNELALPPLEFVHAVQAFVRGLLFQRACFPEVVTEQVALKALESLLSSPQ